MISCPEVVGQGVQTRRTFCDVLIGRDPASGIIVTLPPHSGPVTLTFDLHNRATYSDEEVKAHRAYRRFTATIGVLTLDNTLISRAIVLWSPATRRSARGAVLATSAKAEPVYDL